MISQKKFGRWKTTINQLRSMIYKKNNKQIEKESNKFLPDVAFRRYDASS